MSALYPRITHVMRIGKQHVFLQWTVEGLDPTVGALTFNVQRSTNHFEDFEDLATDITDPFISIQLDNTEELNILSQYRSMTFRIGLQLSAPDKDIEYSLPVDLLGNILVENDVVDNFGLVPVEQDQYDHEKLSRTFYKKPKLNRRLQLIRRSKMRQTGLALRYFTGTEVAILKRRHFGTRCTSCYDRVLGTSVSASICPECFGTNWVGGYHTPLITDAKIVTAQAERVVTHPGITVVKQCRIGLPAFPTVEPDDIVVELDNDRRWFIKSLDDKVFRQRLTKQFALATEIGRTNIEYQILADPRLHHHLEYIPLLCA